MEKAIFTLLDTWSGVVGNKYIQQLNYRATLFIPTTYTLFGRPLYLI